MGSLSSGRVRYRFGIPPVRGVLPIHRSTIRALVMLVGRAPRPSRCWFLQQELSDESFVVCYASQIFSPNLLSLLAVGSTVIHDVFHASTALR